MVWQDNAKEQAAVGKKTVCVRQDIIKGAEVPLLYNTNEEGGKKMKTKKIVIGTMAASMLSLSVCSLIPATAAGETVQIIAGKATAEAGEQFEVEVKLSDIPAAGVQACAFSLEFDNSIIKVDEVTPGTITDVGAVDPSSGYLPNFNYYDKSDEGYLSVMWSTAVDDSTYWLKGEGVLCVVKGTVLSDAKPGSVSEIKIAPGKHDTFSGSGIPNEEIHIGYMDGSKRVAYEAKPTNGSVTVAGGGTETTKPPTSEEKALKGDANCDGEVTIADSAAILQYLGNMDKYPLSAQGEKNSEVAEPEGITANDALQIQMLDAGKIESL